jgi:predicted DNA-binding antitoxin AbrB/MazE fold protein
MTQRKVVRAIYHEGSLQLLEPVDLPEGVELQITVPMSDTMETTPSALVYPTRPQSSETLSRLCSLIAIGGDALVESEILDNDHCD